MTENGILELIDSYLDGQADSAGVARLREWLAADKANAQLFAQQVYLHRQLREILIAENTAECLTAATDEEIANQVRASDSTVARRILRAVGARDRYGLAGFAFSLAVACMLLIAAFLLGRKMSSGDVAQHPAAAPEPVAYVAKLVKVSNCHWDSRRTTADLNRGSQLNAGQSLHLLEGVAEFNSTAPSGMIDKFRLEGPAGLTMGSEGIPSLLYGRLSAESTIDSATFSLDTPLGRLTVSEDAGFGVVANSNEVEVHVFYGSAMFEPLLRFRNEKLEGAYPVSSGSALRIMAGAENALSVASMVAQEDGFITQGSLNASRLNITAQYVAAIKAAAPIAYWRFNDVREGQVPNEMSEEYACRIEGPVRWRTYAGGNRSAEFGFTNDAGFLITDGTLNDALRDGFTIELWMKPSYSQRSSVFSLMECAQPGIEVPLQCVLLELYGRAADPGSVNRSQIRFLHRTPPSRDITAGVDCISQIQYAPRKWQHLAAVKDSSTLSLYLDGRRIAESADATDTPAGLRVLMGQLFSFRTGPNAGIRPFVGEMAEVAIYDRALDDKELLDHIKLTHEESASRDAL